VKRKVWFSKTICVLNFVNEDDAKDIKYFYNYKLRKNNSRYVDRRIELLLDAIILHKDIQDK